MEKKGGGQDSECSKYEMEESPSEENRKIRRDKAEEAGAEENIEGRTFPMALSLPDDLIGRVFSQLDCVDLLECSVVCKQWYRDSAELREAWRNEYLEAWRCYGLCIKRQTHPPSSTCSITSVHSWCP
ncbi:hypothetical protein ZOSMA_213G00020 [Zostera marina]|uniref:F-box domain-containing protein n=1 Tax=Zostera marina TaxID=29655 RepID=A0A0K9PKG3_ZOSMR|nr:hypothetical protein ZOSMA_213G00020 [Zostera marina]